MDTLSVLNIEPSELILKKAIENHNYTFLDDIFMIDLQNYYRLLLSTELFKLKNVYNFLYLRSLKMNYKFPQIEKMELSKNVKYHEHLDELLCSYIQKNKVYAILTMNSIQHYYFPRFSQ